MGKSNREIITFECEDGVTLSGSFFESSPASGSVLVAPATSVSQRFYFPFCEWLQDQGYSVLTFDYRGIGASLFDKSVSEVNAKKQDWGQLDMPAALDWLLETQSRESAVYLVGHSAGGQLVGLIPNYDRFDAIVQVAASTGYVGGSPWPFRWLARFLLAVFMPIGARFLGYIPSKKIGWGENLPAGVGLQWADWCLSPGYLESSFGKGIEEHYYDDISIPILSLSATDDPIATETNVDDLLRLFPRASITMRRLEPQAHDLDSIGHLDFFHTRNRTLWPMVLEGFV